MGENLFQTLVMNLTEYADDPDQDRPAWELDDSEEVAKQDQPAGRVDLLTWQSRRLRVEQVNEDGQWGARSVHFAQGRSLDKSALDPMKSYNAHADRGWLVQSLDVDRAAWRDSATLLNLRSADHRPAEALRWAATAVSRGVLASAQTELIHVFGAGTEAGKAANLQFWRHEVLPIPAAYLTDDVLVECLAEAIQWAESTGQFLRTSLWTFAKELGAGDRASAVVDHLGGDRKFWSRLEPHFLQLLTALPTNRETVEIPLAQWLKTLKQLAVDIFEAIARDLDGSARTLQATAIARRKLHLSLKQFQPLEEQDYEQPAPVA